MSQASLVLPTSGQVSGLTIAQDVNAALAALATQNSGSADPGAIGAYAWWADTGNGLLKQRNAANTGWVTICTLLAALAPVGGTAGQSFLVGSATLAGHAVPLSQMQSAQLGANAVTPLSVATTLTAANAGQLIVLNAAIAATLPAASALKAGQAIQFFSTIAGASVLRAGTTDAITVGGGSTVTSLTLNAGDTLTLESNGAGGWYAVGGSVQLGSSTAFGASIASSGYQRLPSGLIIQWGAGNGSTSADQTAVFPIAFPTTVLSISMTCVNGAAYVAAVSGGSKASFTFNAWSVAASPSRSTAGVYWIAIGY